MKFLYYYDRYKFSVQSRLSLLIHEAKYKNFLAQYQYAFQDKSGLEIGGPSRLFSTSILPVYEWAKTIDGCNFSNNTLWEGAIETTAYTYFPNKSGRQFILDGTALNGVGNDQYDFLLSSHNLEHIANPLKAIEEWQRVLKPGGHMLLVLPDKNFTFDRKREYTTFEHILSDYKAGIQEDDLTHLPEILDLHDLSLDPSAGRDYHAFKKRGENNFINRGLHHHVFSQELLKSSLEYFKIKPVVQYFLPPFHQMILGQNS